MSTSQRKQPSGAMHMKSMTNVFMKLFDTLEEEHVKLQALELRRVQLTQEMRVLHETLKKQNHELRIAENAQRERIYRAQRQLKKSSESTMSGRGSHSKSLSVRTTSAKVKQVASIASVNLSKNVGAAGILGKSQGGSKSPKNFSLGSPPSRTTTFTVDSPPSTTAMLVKTPKLSRAGSRISTVSSTSKKLKSRVKKLANEATRKVIPGNKSFTLVRPSKVYENRSKKPEDKPEIKILPKPALKSKDSSKDPSKSSQRSSVSIAGAQILGMSRLVKNIVAPPPPPPPPPSTLRKVLATLGLTQLVGPSFTQDHQPAPLTPAPPAVADAESAGAPSAPSAHSTETAITTSTAPRPVEITPITSMAVPARSLYKISADTQQTVKLPDTPKSKLEAEPKQKSKTSLPQQHSLHVIKEPRAMPDASHSQFNVHKVNKAETKVYSLKEPAQSEARVSRREKPKTKDRKDKKKRMDRRPSAKEKRASEQLGFKSISSLEEIENSPSPIIFVLP